MNRDAAARLLVRRLAPDITWTVPGQNSVAGTYRGLEEVLEYFRRRRDLAARSFQLQRRDILVGDGDRIAGLTYGVATIRGVPHAWSTVGLYQVGEDQIAACWLLPLDQREFDAIWSTEADTCEAIQHQHPAARSGRRTNEDADT